MSAILGKKLGMTQLFREDGEVVPVTVIEAGPCPVTAIRNEERDGYSAIQLAFDEVKESKLSKAEVGHLAKADASPMRVLVEFRDVELPAAGSAGEEGSEGEEAEGDGGEVKLGQQVTVEAFEEGQKVKVAGITIGKGFQGTVKRHNFGRGPVSHGSHNVRAPGSIGASAWPARVFKGMRLPGQMGGKRRTQLGLEIAGIDADRNLLMIKGSVPGAKNSIVEIRTDG
ncbi:MAG TPA: 50S ribosomal protein L3 [Solirubrobacterales bacterium]|nr:50S ribosomal protein L3 [Solirubrobacterales bacterium]HMX70942.1 50S ribosomal protein L3 [Solirubrobacterales bacterium]HNA43514.1 50S ribosomal protein L3 [Solirubrobacterales bacterium]HNE76513.1 50S ribosomal protein L3 [Solirubrobacterales bacterium]HNG56634.1 50S ribosomal protein L3 [Solirubrobacterales bacterium]